MRQTDPLIPLESMDPLWERDHMEERGMDDRARLLTDLNSCQAAILSALADEAEERGDPIKASGWRYLAERGCWPIQVNDHWEWWIDRPERRFSCALPEPLIRQVRLVNRTGRGDTCRFPSASQALGCAALCAGMILKKLADCPGD